ncbi:MULTISPECIES: hypothetical protein [Streptomyces]|uniref:hypothetical protein n=1 Tax=Streptomyces TaxID=1883 RepID=UPI0016788E7F|nr:MULTISPECIES: hypothetical protein [Streptomyces]MBD3578822.1 hypothetical protein [Streptomyces sp. KD18]
MEDHDVVVPKSVSVNEQREQPQLFWRHLTFTNGIEVRIIDPHEADRTPRLERLRCTVEENPQSATAGYCRPARGS